MSNNVETRAAALAEVQRLLGKSDFSKADSARCEYLLRLSDQLNPAIHELRRIRMAEISAEAARLDPAHANEYRLTPGVRELSAVSRNFDIALRHGKDFLPEESRALAVGTGGSGGYLAPQEFSQTLFSALKLYDPLFSADVCTQITTDHGTAMPIAIVDDGTGAASVFAENAQITEADVSFAQASLPAGSKWCAPMIRVSRELVEDSSFDLQTYLANTFAPRFGRGIGTAMVSDIITGTTQGAVCPTGSTTSIPYDSLLDLVGSVDPLYLQSPKTFWLMRYPTLIGLLKLKSAANGVAMIDEDNRDALGRLLLFEKPVLTVFRAVRGIRSSCVLGIYAS
jgi:HK97 family phage major capsid protein